MDSVLLKLLQLWDWWGPNGAWLLPTGTRWRTYPCSTRRDEGSKARRAVNWPRVNNIPAELVKAGVEDTLDVLAQMCNKVWKTGEWLTKLTPHSQRRKILSLCKNCRTISIVSNSDAFMCDSIIPIYMPVDDLQYWQHDKATFNIEWEVYC